MFSHWFWFLLSLASVLWYFGLLFYVGIRGAQDIHAMIRQLRSETPAEQGNRASRPKN